MSRFLYLFIIVLLSGNLQSQKIEYARTIIKKLCAPELGGRGYSENNDAEAAELIQKEMKKHRLKPYGKSYEQEFFINVNVLNGNNELVIGGQNLKPAEDFLYKAFSAPVKGKFRTKLLDAQFFKSKKARKRLLKKDLSNRALLIDTAGLNDKKTYENFHKNYLSRNQLDARIIIYVSDAGLVYVPAAEQRNYSEIILKREALPDSFEKIKIDLDAEYLKNEKTQNLIGYLKGESDSCIVLSAHYDHIGTMGEGVYFPGAHDNASGVAIALDIARHYADRRSLPPYTLVFMFFSGEEIGLRGSKYYTDNPLFPLSDIKMLINLDIVGSGDAGIKVVNGSVFKKEFDLLQNINQKNNFLKDVKIRGAAANSDHYFFYRKGVPSFFIYTLGEYKEYHNIYDRADALPLSGYEGLFKLVCKFTESL